MTQPQINPNEPVNPNGPTNPADTNTDSQTVSFEQTSVTDPTTGDTLTETITTEAVADTADGASDVTSADAAYDTAASASASAYDATAATPTSDSAYGTTTSAYTAGASAYDASAYPQTPADMPAVDSMGNPYMTTPTSSPYEHAPSYDATTSTMPIGAVPNYAAPNTVQQPNYTVPNGGHPQGAYAAPTTYYVARNKILAGLLALFFGMFGIHNFYLGYTGRAVAQLLLTVLGWIVLGLGPLAALIWSWVEGVRILTSDYGTPEHRDARGVELMD